MRNGGSKQKGSNFERQCCRELSLWVSHGKHEDLFWRSAMSGGRATVAARKGKKLNRQAGDISAVSPEGHALTDTCYIEVKHLKDLNLMALVTRNVGPLAKHWKTAKREARRYRRLPFMILRQNRMPTIVVCKTGTLKRLVEIEPGTQHMTFGVMEVWLWEEVQACTFNTDP